jgi:hypothetical protein
VVGLPEVVLLGVVLSVEVPVAPVPLVALPVVLDEVPLVVVVELLGVVVAAPLPEVVPVPASELLAVFRPQPATPSDSVAAAKRVTKPVLSCFVFILMGFQSFWERP